MRILFLAVFISLMSCSPDAPAQPAGNGVPHPVFDLAKVPEIELTVPLSQWNALLSNYDQNPKNEKKVVARFTFKTGGETVFLDSIGLKLRGNTSRRRPEGIAGQPHNAANPDWHHCHFGLDFDKNRPDQRFKGLSKLNLKWFKDDANYVREIYSYDLFRRFGVWTAPRASYCRLTIRVEGGAQPAYYGVYSMIESVDEDYIAARSAHWCNAVGFMWKGSHIGNFQPDFVSTSSMGVEDVKMNPAKSQYFAYDLKTRKDELASAKASLTQFITDLNSKTGNEFKTWISDRMDVDLFLKTYATNVMLGMWDDYWVNTNNFYFYIAPDQKAYFIPYDYDNALGTSMIVPNSGTQDPLNWGPQSRPLVAKILAVPEFRQKYKNYISELADGNRDLFDAARSKQRILSWQALIAPHVSNDTGEDMNIGDAPASWGNAPFYRLMSGNDKGGATGPANYFSTRTKSIPWQ